MGAQREVASMGVLMALEPRLLFDGAAAVCADIFVDEAPLPELEQPRASGPLSNHPPRLDGIAQMPEVWAGQTLEFNQDNAAGGVGRGQMVSVADPDGPGPEGEYWVTVAGYHGMVSVSDDGSASIYENGTTHVSIAGDLAEVNAALSGLSFTPDAHYQGDTALRITVVQPGGAGEAGQINIGVRNDNEAPVAVDDLVSLGTSRGPIGGNVLAGVPLGIGADSDPDGDPIGVVGLVAGATTDIPLSDLTQAVDGAYGRLIISCEGDFSYEPNERANALAEGETVTDIFSYRIADAERGMATAALRIEIVGVGDDTTPTTPTPTPPPVVVGPPTGQPMVPVPPGLPGGEPQPLPVTPNGEPTLPTTPSVLPPATGTQLSDPVLVASALPAVAPVSDLLGSRVLPGSDFSPFSPTAVLGRIEAEREKKAAELRRVAVAPVQAEDDCLPKPKPKVVKRSALVEAEVVKPKPSTFSEQVQKEKKRLKAPVKASQARGKDC